MLTGIIILGSFGSLPFAEAQTVTHMLESCLNGATFMVQGEVGTAGTLGVDYALGTYLAGGNGGLGHGFGNAYAFETFHFIYLGENGFVTTPSVGGITGYLEDADHNWAQGTTLPIVVDLGAGNAADQAIVFNSIDHLGVNCASPNADEALWDAMIEGIEFTVYGTNDAADAAAAAATVNVFSGSEAGQVPGVGPGSTFEQGTLDYVFNDGWADFGNTFEGDDFASVWQFSQPYRYIAVYSDFTDPFLGDAFQSSDNELDAIGRFLTPVGDPCPTCESVIGGELLPIDNTVLILSGIQTSSIWMFPVIAGAASVVVFYLKLRKN